MGRISKEELLEKTDGGLNIILEYYPQARDCVGKKKLFKARPEKTTSASLHFNEQKGYWTVTDFGDDQKPRNAIDICMLEERVDYGRALRLLAERYGISPEEKQIFYKPEMSSRKATQEELALPDNFYWKEKDFSEDDLAVLGPYVTAELCHKYFLYNVEEYGYVKDGKILIFRATEHYPIFIFNFGKWKKLYQPRSLDKKYRFRYVGGRPKDFIFGLSQAKDAYERLNDTDDDYDDLDEEDKKESRKRKKLSEVINCSGDRDALNVASMGYPVVWQNSESAILTKKQMWELRKIAHRVMNLPDLDETGQKQGHKLAMEYLDMYTIELPKDLLRKKDFRGNPCKDLTDYTKYYDQNHFKDLVATAMPYQMWNEQVKITKGKVSYNYSFNNAHCYYFLEKNGFFRLKMPNTKQGYIYIRIEGNVVTEVDPVEIKAFINSFLQEKMLPPELRNTFYRAQNQLSEKSLSNLQEVELDFTNYTRDSQYLFFSNETWEVTKDGIQIHPRGKAGRYVWADEVIDHEIKEAEAPFEVSYDTKADRYRIKVNNEESTLFRFLRNTSRMHWRKELEQKEKLTKEEVLEQEEHLINKIYAFGYLLHRYRDKSRPWCVFAMDNKVSAIGESHGGSGKSLMMYAVRQLLRKNVVLEGRKPNLTDNPHIWEQVNKHTQLILIDDANQNLRFDFFFSALSGDMSVNPKHGKQFTIEFKYLPKMAITSNFTPRDPDPSTERRILYTVFSDYYHFNKDGEYLENRTVADEFGKNLFDDYTKDEWNADFNFIAHCLKTYLSFPKINPPMFNINLRNQRAEMGEEFLLWADKFFHPESGNLDTEVIKDYAWNDFTGGKNKQYWTANRFKKALAAYAKYTGMMFNPKEMCTGSKDRILKSHEGKTTEFIYMATTPVSEAQEAFAKKQEEWLNDPNEKF